MYGNQEYGEEYYEEYGDLGDDDFEQMAELEKEMAKAGVVGDATSAGASYQKKGSTGGGAYVPSGATPSQGTNTSVIS